MPITTLRPAPMPDSPRSPAMAGHAESIERSHLRCAALGLKRIERPDFAPLLRSDLQVALERNQRLSSQAAPIMELLADQIRETQSMIVLTDAMGTILHTVGDLEFMQRADKVALAPGVNWAEQSKGTNAIGTALFDEQAVLVHGGEHFMHANGFLTCSAAPIFDPRGNILGVLDVTGEQHSYHPHTMGLVRMSARMIENHWLAEDFKHRLRLHFHSRPEFIGTLMEGILVVGMDGRVLGANRSALDQLGMSGAQLRMQSLASLFGSSVSAVVDHFRAPLPTPMAVHAPGGPLLQMVARFNPRLLDVDGALEAAPPQTGGGAAGTAEASGRSPARPNGAAGEMDGGSAGEPSVTRASSGALAPVTAPVPVHAAEPRVGSNGFSGLQYLLTGCPQVRSVVDKIRRVLDRDIPLLILGETGTGKELVARAVHHDSQRARQAFVAVNCASIPESLIEAELFGYEDGAFTGARRKGSTGRILQAHGGTLFLDEIGDMPLSLQARLLRVLQDRQVTPLGSTKSIPVDVALIGATHRNLREMIEQGLFREDLYYRLNGLTVRLPALRDRPDLLAVATRILVSLRPSDTPQLSPRVRERFAQYHWPGNIRQLSNVLRTASVMAGTDGVITEDHLSDDFVEDLQRQGRRAEAAPRAGLEAAAEAGAGGGETDRRAATQSSAPAREDGSASSPVKADLRAGIWREPPPQAPIEVETLRAPIGAGAPLSPAAASDGATPAAAAPRNEPRTLPALPASAGAGQTLEEIERATIQQALEACGGNISEASKRLGISRNTIYRKLRWNHPT